MKPLKTFFLLSITVMLFTSCSILQHPLSAKYDKTADSIATSMTSEMINDMATWQPGITYNDALPVYDKAEASAQSLLSVDAMHKHNTQELSIINEFISQVEQTKAAHQVAGTFNASQLAINVGLLKQAAHIVATTESKYK